MNGLDRFETEFAASWPPNAWKDVTVLLAVSGGADSVALLRAAVAVKKGGAGRLIVAHFHHGLRGDQADGDERFVAELCQRLGVECCIGRAANDSGDVGPPVRAEEALRQQRYAFLRSTADTVGARLAATAHTADDQVETVLHRIVRGTGLRGLGGIPRTRDLSELATLVRPLLNFRRSEVATYLERLGQPFREDASNRDLAFTRNRIRHELLPRLETDYNEQAAGALLRLAKLAQEAQSAVDELAESLIQRCAQMRGNDEVVIDCAPLAAVSDYLQREMLKGIWTRRQWPQQAMGYDQWGELAALLAIGGQPAAREFPGGVRASREGDMVTLRGSGASAP